MEPHSCRGKESTVWLNRMTNHPLYCCLGDTRLKTRTHTHKEVGIDMEELQEIKGTGSLPRVAEAIGRRQQPTTSVNEEKEKR